MLLTKWAPLIKAGDPIESDSAKLALAKVFENTYKEFKNHGLITEAAHGSFEAAGAMPKHAMGQGVPLGTGRLSSGRPGKGRSNGVLTGPLGREGAQAAGANNDFYMPNIIMPMLRRIFPTLIANELVGVQPLNGPLGYALAYRAKYGPNGHLGYGDINNQLTSEIGFNPVDTRFTGDMGITSLTGDAGKWVHECENADGHAGCVPAQEENAYASAWKAYAGTEAVVPPADNEHGGKWFGQGSPLGPQSEFASFSQGTYPTVGFDLIKTAVEAKTRKLGAAWSPELAEDMENMHGMDVEAEMINIISYELGAEIDRQIVSEMVAAAIGGGSVSVWSPAMADGLNQMERLATLLTQITIEANQIALKTRRGNANFVITSPRVCALLEQMSLNKFVSIQNSKNIPSVPDSGVGAITKTGMINDGAQLLVRDSYAPGEYVLMGYKGSHPADSGIVYCPYIPVQLSKVLNPDTLTPQVGARTRYGVMASPWDAKNYYHFIEIKGLTQGYAWNSQRHFIQPYTQVNNGTIFA